MAEWKLYRYVFWMVPALAMLCCSQAAAGSVPVLKGAVSYSEPMAWDYDRDGKANQVRMWIAFAVRLPVGKKGETGFVPGKGVMRRSIRDMATSKPVVGYGMRNMLADNPPGQPVELTDITRLGKSVSFNAGAIRYTVTDGGPGYQADSIMISDGINEYRLVLYDGDLVIGDEQPEQ